MNNRKQNLLETYARLFKDKPASNDAKLINARLLKENESPFSSDGWNEDFFEDMGLMDAIDEVAEISYEIKNARRGSYATDGTLSGIADQLFRIAEAFESAANELMENRDIYPDEE